MGRARQFPLLYDEEWLAHHYEDRGMSAAAIAREIGCSEKAVSRVLRLAGYSRANRAPALVPSDLDDPGFLRTEYLIKRRSYASIAVQLGCNPSTVRSACIRHGVPVRHGMAAPLEPATCRCETPLRTEDGCFHCGRAIRLTAAA